LSKKLFVTDIDGTLLNDKVGLSQDVIDAAREFVERGNAFTICTGRSKIGAEHVALQLPLNAPALLMTGSHFYDFAERKSVHHVALDASIWFLLTFIMQDYSDMAVQVFTPEEIFTLRSNTIFKNRGVRAEQQDEITDFNKAMESEICKVLLVHEDREKIKQAKVFIEDYEQKIGKRLFNADFASRHFFEIVSIDAGKDTALQKLAMDLDIPKQDIIVAGDGLTDLPMFQHAGCSFAPVDTIEKVKQEADKLFPSAKEHGLFEVFKELMD
jgi:Cof subfamily protein (haloacid dehalogenase superfamily)